MGSTVISSRSSAVCNSDFVNGGCCWLGARSVSYGRVASLVPFPRVLLFLVHQKVAIPIQARPKTTPMTISEIALPEMLLPTDRLRFGVVVTVWECLVYLRTRELSTAVKGLFADPALLTSREKDGRPGRHVFKLYIVRGQATIQRRTAANVDCLRTRQFADASCAIQGGLEANRLSV
jgi:hypothetical protein